MSKSGLKVTIDSILRNLNKNIKFLQPVYETIINSLEANATEIDVIFYYENTLDDKKFTPIVNGFQIIDNGEGFNSKNLLAFTEFWTQNKISLGCKGSGRFTWLNVFTNIDITSKVPSEKKVVTINFSRNFSEKKDIILQSYDDKINKTSIIFSGVTNEYYPQTKGNIKTKDLREYADLPALKKSIEEYLLIKLFLLKNANRKFVIRLHLDEITEIISDNTIPCLESVDFNIISDLTDEAFSFTLYYKFYNDKRNSKKVYFCANLRATKEIDDDSLGFSNALPNKESFIMLLVSPYLNDKDDDSRNDMTYLANLKTADLIHPLLISDIVKETKKIMRSIIEQKFHNLDDYNSVAIRQATEEAPHLTKFINEVDDIVKSKEALIKTANRAFNAAKLTTKTKFITSLNKSKIDDTEFVNALKEVSYMAYAELGEYILYRDSIIDALKKSVFDETKKEDFIHNIFMPMRTESSESPEYLLNNLWLLDDKFMTFSYVASDKSFKYINNSIGDGKPLSGKFMNRPDMTILFNREGTNQKDAVLVEFKGLNASFKEKKESLTELPDDISILRKNISNINSIWGYIITKIDDEFEDTIQNQDFKKLFASDGKHLQYYKYLDNVNAHIYVIDIETIVSDSKSRNNVFLKILKKQ